METISMPHLNWTSFPAVGPGGVVWEGNFQMQERESDLKMQENESGLK